MSSIAPLSISTLVIITSPDPCGVIVIFPLAPSVILIEPVVELPVFKITSWSPLDLKIPAALPVPAATSPFITTVPFVEFVMVSPFSNLSPFAPVISTLLEAVTLVNVPDAALLAPISVPSI